ncbi:MAG: outer membrane lipoprotein chaperone LolA [Colwellia sp.]|nr:outer membrane lipoprotein chaperone LolA [Colwellia sp.]
MFEQIKSITFSKKAFSLPMLILSLAVVSTSYAQIKTEQSTEKLDNQKLTSSKQLLMAKLGQIQYINAKFSQVIVDETSEVLQEGKGLLSISKPNLVYWHTTEPDETLIVSDGKDLWFYNPFIDQVSVYSFTNSIANTPVLLLTSEDPTLWDAYQVSQQGTNSFLIHSLDVNSQVKSLELTFNKDKLSKLSILDSTGQMSHISLIDVDFTTKPKETLFKFNVPEGVMVDDQR